MMKLLWKKTSAAHLLGSDSRCKGMAEFFVSQDFQSTFVETFSLESQQNKTSARVADSALEDGARRAVQKL